MGANPPTILIVDDTPENLSVLGELLQPAYRVRAANSGRRALQIALGNTGHTGHPGHFCHGHGRDGR